MLQLKGYGLKPMSVLLAMDQMANAGLLLEAAPSPEALCADRVTLRDIKNVFLAASRDTQLDSNDVRATQQLVEHVRQFGTTPEAHLLYFEPEGSAGFQLAYSSPFQRRMLKEFGAKLVFMDAVFGTNIYGYPMLTLLVQDDYGNGVPVGFCIAEYENADTWLRFLQAMMAVSACMPLHPPFLHFFGVSFLQH